MHVDGSGQITESRQQNELLLVADRFRLSITISLLQPESPRFEITKRDRVTKPVTPIKTKNKTGTVTYIFLLISFMMTCTAIKLSVFLFIIIIASKIRHHRHLHKVVCCM